MKNIFTFAFYCIVVLCLFGCSIDVSQPTADSSTLPSPTNSDLFTMAQTTKVPVTWSNLNLTGKLVYIRSDSLTGSTPSVRVQALDLATGDEAAIFRAPEGAWIYYMSISPDAKQLAISYIAPSGPDALSNRALYIIPLDATELPQLLIAPPTPEDHYVQAEWSPDGKYIYYVHYNYNDRPAGQLDPLYEIFRMAHPDGQPEKIVDNGFWPRISPDSSKLVYVSVDLVSGKNELFLTNADGSDARKIVFSGSLPPEIIDAPIFLPNGQTILFSAPPPTQAYQPSWIEKFMGIQVVKAHSVPSDWWSVPITGGVPTQLTQLQTINLFASISPDKKHIASLSGDGLFVMDLDGSNLTRLLSDPGVLGSVNWIP